MNRSPLRWLTSTSVSTPGVADDGRATLQLIIDSATDLLGFDVGAVALVDGPHISVVAASAPDETTRQEILGLTAELEALLATLDAAEHWGSLEFVSADNPAVQTILEQPSWVPEELPTSPSATPDPAGRVPWQPHDLLGMRLRGSDGDLIGFLSLDVPRSGLRPSVAERSTLAAHAQQAGRALVDAVERQRLSFQMTMATAAQLIIRKASGRESITDLISGVEDELAGAFHADLVWLHVLGEDGAATVVHGRRGPGVALPSALERIAARTSERYWRLQQTNVVGTDEPDPADLSEDELREIRAFQAQAGIQATLFAPLGVGPRCLGHLVIARHEGGSRFSGSERTAALELGHDLGQALARTRLEEQQRRLVAELQEVDAYKTQLIATLAHELKNPLTSVMGYVEVLDGVADSVPGVPDRLEVIAQQGLRMRRLVGDMLILSRLAEAGRVTDHDVVSLRSSVTGAIPHLAGESGSHRVSTDLPDDPVLVTGDAADLERMCGLLMVVGLARSRPEELVRIRLRREGDTAVLTCHQGQAPLSSVERDLYFSEFSSPAGVEAGTGLELAICRQIVVQHGGRIHLLPPGEHQDAVVEVRLPAAAAD